MILDFQVPYLETLIVDKIGYLDVKNAYPLECTNNIQEKNPVSVMYRRSWSLKLSVLCGTKGKRDVYFRFDWSDDNHCYLPLPTSSREKSQVEQTQNICLLVKIKSFIWVFPDQHLLIDPSIGRFGQTLFIDSQMAFSLGLQIGVIHSISPLLCWSLSRVTDILNQYPSKSIHHQNLFLPTIVASIILACKG